jgi:hypothetical protein
MSLLQELSAKAALIEKRGYIYSFDRDLYIQMREKKVFSTDFIEDHEITELESCLDEPSNGDGRWKFYFNEMPPDVVRKEIERGLPGGS